MRGAELNRIAFRLRAFDRLLRERIAQGMTDEQAREGLLDIVKKAEQVQGKRRTKIKLGTW